MQLRGCRAAALQPRKHAQLAVRNVAVQHPFSLAITTLSLPAVPSQQIKQLSIHSPSNTRGVKATANAASSSTNPSTTGAVSSSQHCGVVITGGSKGLGFAMAQQFLSRGDAVLVCGRDAGRLEAAAKALRAQFPSGQVFAERCDVSVAEDVDALAAAAQQHLGTVHLWVNNAGEVTAKKLLTELEASEITRVVGSNVTGSLLCCRAAIKLMQQQRGSATSPAFHIFNLGFSSWGASFSKSACTHKMTKTALTQLTKSLSEELKAAGVNSVGVHNLSPGMVLTDLLLQGASPVARRFFNTLAEEPETVAADLVPRIRAVQGTGTSIEYLSPATAFGRVISGLPQIINGGRFFDKDGNRVPPTGAAEQRGVSSSSVSSAAQYNSAGVRVLYEYPPEKY